MSEVLGKQAYYSVNEIYQRFSITSSTLERWISNKDFPKPLKVGRTRRFAIKDVDKWERDRMN
mgnify:CR=1 FL=1